MISFRNQEKPEDNIKERFFRAMEKSPDRQKMVKNRKAGKVSKTVLTRLEGNALLVQSVRD